MGVDDGVQMIQHERPSEIGTEEVAYLHECCHTLAKTSPQWSAKADQEVLRVLLQGPDEIVRYWLATHTIGGSILFWSGYYSNLPEAVKSTFQAFSQQSRPMPKPRGYR